MCIPLASPGYQTQGPNGFGLCCHGNCLSCRSALQPGEWTGSAWCVDVGVSVPGIRARGGRGGSLASILVELDVFWEGCVCVCCHLAVSTLIPHGAHTDKYIYTVKPL